jgi:hypothetical protein
MAESGEGLDRTILQRKEKEYRGRAQTLRGKLIAQAFPSPPEDSAEGVRECAHRSILQRTRCAAKLEHPLPGLAFCRCIVIDSFPGIFRGRNEAYLMDRGLKVEVLGRDRRRLAEQEQPHHHHRHHHQKSRQQRSRGS